MFFTVSNAHSSNRTRLLIVIGLLVVNTGCGKNSTSNRRYSPLEVSALSLAMGVKGGNSNVDIYTQGTSSEGPIVNPYRRDGDTYKIGLAREDVTGSASGVTMMGYVDFKQKSAGFATRQYARAVVLQESSGAHAVALVVVDSCQITSGMREEVVKIIDQKTNGVLNSQNIMLVATHTHSAPGGLSHYNLYSLSTLGFSEYTYKAMVEGSVKAIENAYKAMTPGRIYVSNGNVKKLNANRSPLAYAENPAEEKDKYNSNVNKMMTVLRFDDLAGQALGMFSWFAVHATTVESDNTLIDSDNKGFAGLVFEKAFDSSQYSAPGKKFVAAFATMEGGDSTPSVEGDLDGDGDWDCTANTNDGCIKYSGGLHATSALTLFASRGAPIQGPLDSVLHFIDMSQIEVTPEFSGKNEIQKTCQAALGISMFAGIAPDHAGVGKEGVRCGEQRFIFGNIMCDGIVDQCHYPKPVALNLGGKKPSPWAPDRLPIQIMRLGQLAFAAVPQEFTTMSGRRTRSVVQSIMGPQQGVEQVLLAGYANAYAGYVATFEEYQLQLYEGASTHFGPWTQAAYTQEIANLAKIMGKPEATRAGLLNKLKPRDLSAERRVPAKTYGLDRSYPLRNFGFCVLDVRASYKQGEGLSAEFVGADLDHALHQGEPIAEIVRIENNNKKTVVVTDEDYELKVIWNDKLLGHSSVTVKWTIPQDFPAGTYQIHYRAKAKVSAEGTLTNFQGYSSNFVVSN
jgi:neutral ceramidase